MLRLEINIRKVITVMLAICTVGGLWAQTPAEQIKKTEDYYKSLISFSVDVSVGFYSEEISAKPQRVMKGYTRISKELSHSLFDGRENIMGTDFILVADHGNKSIYYSPREADGKHKVSKGTEILEGSSLSKYTISTSHTEKNFVFKLVPKGYRSEFKSITIKTDRKTHVLSEIIYMYAGEVKYKKTVITYANFNAAWKPQKDEFSETKFITGRHKQAKLIANYSAYKLINSYTYDPKKNLIDQ